MFLHRPFAFRTQNFFARLGTFFISCLPFFCCPDAAFLFAKF
ncbi:hypothetical protein HMPREF3213_01404 [Heyndrickxia coagulans]|uniref:Uncharacterized protein n=1 Tax=Heyndrickxia coagulans TaxID=1398 RepID=A0A133KUD4_HEYCO|nr:hypothetical protein HMPREF3213_01404 [Heyndrickxia coagulans]